MTREGPLVGDAGGRFVVGRSVGWFVRRRTSWRTPVGSWQWHLAGGASVCRLFLGRLRRFRCGRPTMWRQRSQSVAGRAPARRRDTDTDKRRKKNPFALVVTGEVTSGQQMGRICMSYDMGRITRSFAVGPRNRVWGLGFGPSTSHAPVGMFCWTCCMGLKRRSTRDTRTGGPSGATTTAMGQTGGQERERHGAGPVRANNRHRTSLHKGRRCHLSWGRCLRWWCYRFLSWQSIEYGTPRAYHCYAAGCLGMSCQVQYKSVIRVHRRGN